MPLAFWGKMWNSVYMSLFILPVSFLGIPAGLPAAPSSLWYCSSSPCRDHPHTQRPQCSWGPQPRAVHRHRSGRPNHHDGFTGPDPEWHGEHRPVYAEALSDHQHLHQPWGSYWYITNTLTSEQQPRVTVCLYWWSTSISENCSSVFCCTCLFHFYLLVVLFSFHVFLCLVVCIDFVSPTAQLVSKSYQFCSSFFLISHSPPPCL